MRCVVDFVVVNPDARLDDLRGNDAEEAHSNKHEAADMRAECVQGEQDKRATRRPGARAGSGQRCDPFSASQALDRARSGTRAWPAAW